MKRKLAVCVAMYTGAKTMFLDEPSTGMDPYARRALWRSIHEALLADRCVLLTTHSMEEADAVCARIAIMTNGQLRCIGNSQHLKNRFGSGYTITVQLLPSESQAQGTAEGEGRSPASLLTVLRRANPLDDAEVKHGAEVDRRMQELFGPSCSLKEVLGLQRRYTVDALPKLSAAFASLRSVKEPLRLHSYTVSQLTSLEQIFIGFAGSGGQ